MVDGYNKKWIQREEKIMEKFPYDEKKINYKNTTAHGTYSRKKYFNKRKIIGKIRKIDIIKLLNIMLKPKRELY